MFIAFLSQVKKMLGQLDGWLEAADKFAKERSFDSANYLTLRLAPDQFPFVRQVQSSCDISKFAFSRVTGKEPPKHEDNEKTIAELRERVASVLKYLDGFSAKDFEKSATHVVTNPRWEGKVMSGEDYFVQHGMPNFFFHITHTYALLRHAGVALGKKDYLGALSLRDAK